MATPSTAETVASTRNATIVRRWGRANSATRRNVPGVTARFGRASCMALCNALHMSSRLVGSVPATRASALASTASGAMPPYKFKFT